MVIKKRRQDSLTLRSSILVLRLAHLFCNMPRFC